MTSTDVVAPQAEEIALLQRQQEDEFEAGDGLFTTPILKIAQPLTREVQADEAEVGEFINTLTGEGIGDAVEFVVAYYQRGRFGADRKTGRAYVAFSADIPSAWGDLVGDEFVGTPFTEYPDAEERYKARVNNKEIEWGSGPLVSTTHNFTGLAIVPGLEGDDEDDLQPVRMSLQRTNMPSVRKIMSLKKGMMRNRPFWDKTFQFGTEKKAFDRGAAYLLTVKLGRETTAEEKALAVELAQAVTAGRVSDNQGSNVEKTEAPDAKGGLDV